MKRISLVLCLALMLVALFAVTAFAATYKDITDDARFEQNGSKSDLLDLDKVIDGDYTTGSSCGNDGENWVNYRFYYDEGTTVSKVFVVLNSKGTLSNGKVYETVSDKSYEFYVRLYDKFENTVFNTKYNSGNNATEVKDAEGNVLYTYFEVVFEKPYSDIYMVEVPVVNNKNADVGLWEVEIYNYVCGEDEHKWVGTLCGEHCDVCGELKNPSLACEAEEDDGDCRTAVLCKYCDSVIVASQKHVFAEGETVCSNPGCVFEGKNIAKDTTITPADVSENTYGENGEFLNWWYYSAHITDGKYNTIAHSNYFGQYKFTFNIKNPTKLSEIFIVSNSSGVYHPWGYGHDNLSKDLKVKVIIYDVDGNAIQTVEYNSLDFTNPNVVPIYSESGEMTSVAYKLDANYANAKKVELYINEGVWEVEIYEHVTCDYQFVEVVDPTCTEEGYDLYKCACGNEKHENAVDALGHNYDDGVVTKEPGEEEDGIIVYTCQTCGNEKSLAIPATGHEHNYDSYVGISIEPTCAVVGSATYQCRCGDTTEVEIPATGKHDYSVFVEYTKEPTYLADGYANYKCATCDGFVNVNVGRLQMNTAKYAEVVKELGGWTVCEKYLIDGNYNLGSAGSHTTNGWAFSLNYGEDYTFTKLAFVVNSVGKFPSADAFNFTSKTNKNYSFAITLYDANGKAVWSKSTTCAEAVEMTGTDAEGNQFLYDIVTIELAEAVVASKLYVKINSGWDNGAGMWEVETYGLPVNYHEDHIYSVELERYSDPTCTEDGSALYRCAKCETTSVVELPATGHSYFYPCDVVCQVCNQETNPDAKHTIVHVDAKAADCTNNGNVEYWYCSDCGSAWLDEALTQITNQKNVIVAATGHDWDDATCLAPKTCTVCEKTEGDALAHEYVAGEPAENGAVTYTCKNGCNDAYVINNAAINGTYYADAMTSFVFENGVLTANGETYNYTFNETTGTLTVEGLNEGMIAYVNGKIVFRGKVELHTHDNSIFTEVTKPTCGKEGYTTYICQFCGPLYDADRVPATGMHSYEEVDRTETEVTYACKECGYSYSEDVITHTHTEVEIPAVRPLPSNNHVGSTAGIICSECGETIVAAVEFTAGTSSDKTFKVNSANLSLKEDITITYDATHPANGTVNGMYMVFVVDGEEFVVDTYNLVSGNRYSFNFKDIKSYQMAENIEAYVYAIEDGNYVMNSHLVYSIKQYCINQLKKSTTPETFKALIYDVLEVGKYSQLVKPYKTDALVTDLIEAEGYTLNPTVVTTIDPSYNVQALTGDRTQGYDWKSGQIKMGSSIEIAIDFVADSLDNLELVFDLGNRQITIDAKDAELVSGNRYTVKFQVKITEYANAITCTFNKDGAQIGSTLTYSVLTYIVRQYTVASHGENMLNFMKSVYAYYVSAMAYAGQ